MKYASGYHRLKAKYEALQNDFNFKSEVVNTLIDENNEKVRKIDDLQCQNEILTKNNNSLHDKIREETLRIKLVFMRQKFDKEEIEELKKVNQSQSKLIKVLAFGWVVFIVTFLIFLFTF